MSLRKITFFMPVLVAVFFTVIVSCSTAPKSSSSSSAGNTVNNNNNTNDASTTITSLPDLKLKAVPNSLSAGSDLKLKSMPTRRRLTRAYGDVTNFVASDLPDVKAQGWIDMRSQIKSTPVMDFMSYLKSYASNHTVPLDTDIRLGTSTIEGSMVDMGVVRCTQPVSNTLIIYWTIKMQMDPGSAEMSILPCYIKVVKDNNGKVVIDFLTTISTTVTDPTSGIIPISGIYYSFYNEVSNETLNCSIMNETVMGSPMNTATINHIYPDNNGGMVLLTYDKNVSGYSVMGTNFSVISTNFSIAWGNDLQGGLVSADDSIFSGGGYGNTISSIWTEYYNQDGSLVFNNSGQNTLQDTSWMDSYANNGTNLNDLGIFGTPAPDSFAVIYDYSNYPVVTTTISNVLSHATAVIPNTIYSFYYKSSPSSWGSGDSIYWYDSGTYNGGVSIEILKKGYTVPSSQNFFDKPYYVQNTWPMKYLALQSAYSNYSIMRKEYDTQTYNYTNIWTNLDSSVSTNIDNWSWTDYAWWLAKVPDTDVDPINDIRLQNIQSQDVYIWNGTNMDKEKGLFVYGSDPTPMYFDFMASSLVSSVNTIISNIYEANKNFDAAAFVSNRMPAMPAANLFPVITN